MSVLAFTLALAPAILLAGKVRIEPGVSIKGVYTDNVDLTSSDRKSDFYLQIRPTLNLDSQESSGGRIQFNLNYAMDYTEDLPGERGRTIANNLDAKMNAELYRDMVFLDASAGAGLTSRTSGGQTGSDGVGDTWDPVQTYAFTLSPYFKHHLGRYADLLTRYTFDQVINSGDSSDSFSNGALFSIDSGRYFTRMPWSVSHRHIKVNEQDGADDSETTSIDGKVSYIVNRKWRLNLGLGKTDYDFTSSRSSSTDSVTWDAGATWTPTPRTNLDFSYGRRFHGEDFAFDFSHRWRRAVWTASYGRELTSWRAQTLEAMTLGQFLRNFGSTIQEFQAKANEYLRENGLEEITVDPNTLTTYTVVNLTDEHFVQENFTTGLSLITRRSTLGVRAHYTTRKYEISQTNGRDFGFSINLDRKLTPKTNGNIGLFWQKNREMKGGPEDTRLTFNIGVTKQLTERTNVNLDYQYRRLDSDSSSSMSEYRENQISLSLGTRWN